MKIVKQDKMTIPTLTELSAMKKRFSEIYNETGLIGVSIDGVHLREKTFMATFADYETVERHDEDYPHESWTEFQGVKYFCIW